MLGEKLKKIKKLFLTFLKIGAFTFGGGYAMIPFIEQEIVTENHWLTEEEILDMFAIAEATPGVIAINTATFVGYRIGGFWGSAAATVGVALPAFVIILIVSYFFQAFKENKFIAYAFEGIRAGVVVLIIMTVKKMSKPCEKNLFNYILALASFLIVIFTDISVIFVILTSFVLGIVYKILFAKKQLRDGEGK